MTHLALHPLLQRPIQPSTGQPTVIRSYEQTFRAEVRRKLVARGSCARVDDPGGWAATGGAHFLRAELLDKRVDASELGCLVGYYGFNLKIGA